MKRKFSARTLHRERQIILSLISLFSIMILTIFFGLRGVDLNFDNRDQAAGKVYFVENNQDLQDAINKAVDSDAIFLKIGTYTTTDPNGYSIKNKNIRILGAGKDFATVNANKNSYGFNVENSAVQFEGIKIIGANKDGVLVTNSGSKDVVFKDVEISNNSGNGINSDSNVTVRTSLLSQNATGIQSSKNITLENSLIESSVSSALIATGTGNVNIRNTIFNKNGGTAILLQNSGSNTIKNVTLAGNDKGIIETGSSTTQISNSIVANSKTEGITLKNSSSKVTYTNAVNNITSNFNPSSATNTEGNISVDPGFVSATDFHLSGSSASVDKGVPVEKDSNGTRIDMGAFGGNPDLSVANGAPTISSTPPEFVKPGQLYNYEVQANDPDRDTLSYIILNSSAPSWLKLNGNKLSGTPATKDVGFAGVLLLVSDKKGHNIVHPISINVVAPQRSVPVASNPTTTPTVKPTSTPAPSTPVVPQITIQSPKADTVFSGANNEIKWLISGGANIDRIVIKYSDDKDNFKLVTTLPGNQASYKWDTSSLTPGKYVVQVEVTDKGTPPATTTKISDEFEIKAPSGQNTGSGEQIFITKISPSDNDNLTTRSPLIQVEFRPEVDLDLSKTYLKVKGENVEFKTTKNTIFYEPKTDITGNKIQVEAKIVTKDGSEASRKWAFNLPTTTQSQDTTTETQEVSTVLGLPRPIGLALLGIIIVGLLFAILYFILKLIKTVREERQGNLEAEFTEYYGTPDGGAAAKPTPPIAPVQDNNLAKPADEVTVAVTNEYLAPGNQDSEFHLQTPTTEEQAPVTTAVVTQTFVEETKQQPEPQTQESNVITTTTEEPHEYSALPESTHNDNYSFAPAPVQTQSQEQAPIESVVSELPAPTATQEVQVHEQTNNVDFIDPNAVPVSTQSTNQTDDTSNQQSDSQTDDQQMTGQPIAPAPQPADNNAQAASNQQNDNNAEYIESLKKKYNITDKDIVEYKKQEEAANQSISDNLPPDATQASTPPDNK